MSSIDSKKAYKNFKKKGFVDVEKSQDHIRIEFWYNEKLTSSRTKFSHNGQDLNDYLIAQMSKQVNLSKQEFRDFANCNIDQNQYIEILKTKGVI